MKKTTLLAFSFVLFHFCFGQKTTFGIKAGVNIASIKDDNRVPDQQAKPRAGLNVGGLAHIHLSRQWALQPEVVYSTQGADYTFPTYTGKDKLNYINVPVMVQYMLGDGFRLETGPQVGFLTSSEFKPSNGNETEKKDIKSTDFAWSFGLGYVTKSGFGLDGRYNLGLSNLYKEGIYGSNKATNQVGQIGVFYQFKH